jgi:hypothetical protein
MKLLPDEKIELGDSFLTYFGEIRICKRIGDQKIGRVADWNGFVLCKSGEQAYIKIKK